MPGFDKVLVLDDNAFNRALLKDVLEEGGFDAETVADLDGFEKALEWWHPDVLLVDVNMPGKSGTDVVKEVRALASAPPVVLISAMSDASLKQLATQCGADGHFSTLQGMKGIIDVVLEVTGKGAGKSSPGW
jgi:DNA-binding response OmpR family regulator